MMTERKWFAVYTMPRWEKKVAERLSRSKIENYCPLNRVVRQWADRKKIVHEPLFTSYVFVRATEADLTFLKKIDGIINLVYWVGKPAVIRDEEIHAIRRFLEDYQNVKLEKTTVNINDAVRVVTGPFMGQEGRVVAVKSKTIKIILPSLGYLMSAEVEMTKVELIRNEINLNARHYAITSDGNNFN